MPRPRDNQRQRLYDAEEAAQFKMTGKRWQQTIKNADLQPWVDAVMAKRAISSRWPNKKIKVELGKGGGRGWYSEISLGVAARNEWVILHEVAHCLVPHGDYAPHGPEFVGIFTFLIETVLGKPSATAFREQCLAHRVRKSNALIPKPLDKTEKYLLAEISKAREERAEVGRRLADLSLQLSQHRATMRETG